MNEVTRNKRGRPVGSVSENTADKQLPRIRVTQSQLDTYKAASKLRGKTLSAWVRESLDSAVREGGTGQG